MRAATPSSRAAARRRCIRSTTAPASSLRATAATSGCAAHVARLRDERLLVRIAVRDRARRSGATHQREAVLADADPIDHPPHLFEAELADQPARRLVEPRQMDGERPSSAAGPRRRGCGDIATPSIDERGRASGSSTRGLPTRLVAIDVARLVEQRDLAEFAELQDVVLEDAILLPRLEAGVLEVGGERLQELGVGRRRSGGFPRRRASRRCGCP